MWQPYSDSAKVNRNKLTYYETTLWTSFKVNEVFLNNFIYTPIQKTGRGYMYKV
jgi:hypothetical protein